AILDAMQPGQASARAGAEANSGSAAIVSRKTARPHTTRPSPRPSSSPQKRLQGGDFAASFARATSACNRRCFRRALHTRKRAMSADLDQSFGFAPDHDASIPYMRRTRKYYQAIGYATPYRWAHFVEAPFHPLAKPLAQARVTIVTTAAPYDPVKG